MNTAIAKQTAEPNAKRLKKTPSSGVEVITETSPIAPLVTHSTMELIVSFLFGRINAKNDGSVLYSIPNIIKIGKRSHSCVYTKECRFISNAEITLHAISKENEIVMK